MATKEIICYFKRKESDALLYSISQSTVDSVNKEFAALSSVDDSQVESDCLKNGRSRGEYIKISAK